MGVLFKVFYVISCYFTGRNLLVKSVAPSSFISTLKLLVIPVTWSNFQIFWFLMRGFVIDFLFRIACMHPWRLLEIGVGLSFGIWRYYRLSAPDMALELSIVCFSLFKIIFNQGQHFLSFLPFFNFVELSAALFLKGFHF